jgi:hypothetical protein
VKRPVSVDAAFQLEPVTAVGGVQSGGFFVLQDSESGRYLSRALDTNVVASEAHEKVFRITFVDKYSALAIKGHTRMHLTNELSNKITVDRPWARGYEMWAFEQHAGGKDLFVLRSIRNHMLVAHGEHDAGALVAEDDQVAHAIKWRVFRVTSCDSEDSCWGKETAFAASPGAKPGKKAKKGKKAVTEAPAAADPVAAAAREHALMQRLAAAGPFPIIGSPKPLKSDAPLRHDDPWDAITISARTMTNWASIPGLVTLQLTDDDMTLRVIARLNAQAANGTRGAVLPAGERAACGAPLTRIQHNEKTEVHPTYKQPTYRGLFHRGLELFPDAPCVMFSNGDILYTPSLTQTIQRVIEFMADKKAAEVRAGRKWHDRWMIVGQRINHEVPAAFDIDDDAAASARRKADPTAIGKARACTGGFPHWVRELETYAGQGKIFQSDAEDYFIVSRKLFDWMKLPDFIVGGVAFDNWITAKVARMALKGEAVLVDATKTVTALHQNHGRDERQAT